MQALLSAHQTIAHVQIQFHKVTVLVEHIGGSYGWKRIHEVPNTALREHRGASYHFRALK